MAIKWLDAKRLQGTNAERLALTTIETKSLDVHDADYVTAGGSAGDYNFLCGNSGGSGDFSISCWIKPDSGCPDKAIILDQFGFNSTNYVGFGARFNNSSGNRTISCGISPQGSFPSVTTGADWVEDSWQYLTITYDSGTMKVYRNGVENVSGSVASTDSTPSFVLRIGDTNSDDNPLDGYISDLLLTDDVLSADEISALASGTTVDNVSPAIDNQELHYTFFTDLTDSSGEGRNGTPTGSSPSGGSGLVGTGGGTLPLTSEYPNLPNGIIFNETDAYKYFMWNGTDTWNQMVSS